MKKITLIFASILALSILVGCGGSDTNASGANTAPKIVHPIFGIWENDGTEGMFSNMIEKMSLSADGEIVVYYDEGDPFEGEYSVTEMEEGIFKSRTMPAFPDEGVREQFENRRKELLADNLKIAFNFSDLEAEPASLIFHKETHELREFIGGEPRNDWLVVSSWLANGSGQIYADFSVDEVESVILQTLEQGASEGEVEPLRIQERPNTAGFTDMGDLPTIESSPITFSIELFTEEDFIDMNSSIWFWRIESNTLREFPTLEAARNNQDKALIWSAVRAD